MLILIQLSVSKHTWYFACLNSVGALPNILVSGCSTNHMSEKGQIFFPLTGKQSISGFQLHFHLFLLNKYDLLLSVFVSQMIKSTDILHFMGINLFIFYQDTKFTIIFFCWSLTLKYEVLPDMSYVCLLLCHWVYIRVTFPINFIPIF